MNRKKNLALVSLLTASILLTGCTGDGGKKEETSKTNETTGAAIPEKERTVVEEAEAPAEPGEAVAQNTLSDAQKTLYEGLTTLKAAFEKAPNDTLSQGELTSEGVPDATKTRKGKPGLTFLKNLKLSEGLTFSWELEKGALRNLSVTDNTNVIFFEDSKIRSGDFLLFPQPAGEASDFAKDTETLFVAVDEYYTEHKAIPVIALDEKNFIVQAGLYGTKTTLPKVELPRSEGTFIQSFTSTTEDWSAELFNESTKEFSVFNSDNFEVFYLYPLQ